MKTSGKLKNLPYTHTYMGKKPEPDEDWASIEKALESEYVKLNPGEAITLRVEPTPPQVVQGKYGTRFIWTVVLPSGEIKKLSTGKRLSRMIYEYVKNGKYTLKITRRGTGLDTTYWVEPA